ncbi:MAG: hypothetical protein KY429_12065 [Actinobacteria bacterium]|nr:hypothetical protein [Actinomycetota bacterium]
MEETFTCEECGKSFPKRQMKEVFIWEGKKRLRRELCPSCLDKAMKQGRVHGVVGDAKKAAASITPGEGNEERGSIK